MHSFRQTLTLLLYTPATSLLACGILNCILHKKSPFQHGLNFLPILFHFMPLAHIAMAQDLGDAAQTNFAIC